jgi:DNA-binding NtrC family response regulator
MQLARQQAMLAAETVAPVLITGPPGSGRETLANAIHYGRDGERSGGMIPVDCHALPAALIDSTIRAFYQRYAKSDRQKCHTLLLNNADLLEPGQAELVVSVIANNPGHLRIIGTSSLEPRAWQNHPTLPWHLATIKIHLPPLIERQDDIPLLAQWFLEQQNARALQEDKKPGQPKSNAAVAQRSGFAADALDLLTLYHWPGNMDELVHVAAESHANAKGTLVRANDLPIRLHQTADAQAIRSVEEQIDLENYLHSLELELIQRALKAARGNKAKAARLLGMTRPRLYRRLEQLGLVELPTPEFSVMEQEDALPDDLPDFRDVDSEKY